MAVVQPMLIYVIFSTRCNRIWAGQAAGIAVTEEGFGHVYFNDICGMEWGGIDIRNGGHPVIMNNTIHKGHGDGVVIGKRGCGLIFENVIRSKCRGQTLFYTLSNVGQSKARARSQYSH